MNNNGYAGKPYFMENDKYFAKKNIIVEKGFHRGEPPHTHDFIEFVYTYRGKIVHTIDSTEYPTSKGDLVIVNYDQVHYYNGSKDLQYYNFLIKPEYINESISSSNDFYDLLELKNYKDFKNLVNHNNPVIKFSPEERVTFEHLLSILDYEIKSMQIGYETISYSIVNVLITMILRKMSISYANVENSIDDILAYINENFSENISETHVASLYHYNPSYFSRMFKNHTGITFTEYIKKIRIRAACDMLLSTDIKIIDICNKVGYTNKTKFHRHFRDIIGVTPLAYKKSKR